MAKTVEKHCVKTWIEKDHGELGTNIRFLVGESPDISPNAIEHNRMTSRRQCQNFPLPLRFGNSFIYCKNITTINS